LRGASTRGPRGAEPISVGVSERPGPRSGTPIGARAEAVTATAAPTAGATREWR